jgi:hypothetical protein
VKGWSKTPESVAPRAVAPESLAPENRLPEVGSAGRIDIGHNDRSIRTGQIVKRKLASRSGIAKAELDGRRDREIQTAKVQAVTIICFSARLRDSRAWS